MRNSTCYVFGISSINKLQNPIGNTTCIGNLSSINIPLFVVVSVGVLVTVVIVAIIVSAVLVAVVVLVVIVVVVSVIVAVAVAVIVVIVLVSVIVAVAVIVVIVLVSVIVAVAVFVFMKHSKLLHATETGDIDNSLGSPQQPCSAITTSFLFLAR